ncbi:patatin-like phospholipase family protein [Rhodoferax sp.]|uniref:patatin-like phospholipase family protein n=1 Tax=Rhodoferax sp. TaxID=50421 RepID=UPI0025E192F1|nr:patatin-like phospholipase family protein [Rhodoferax sp.]MCM2341238.1 patatin-like phospholipase family protein [Rhodoferax sp.]
MPTDYPEQVLTHHLQRMLGDVDAEALQLLRSHLTWFELAAGATLMRQGDPGDAMYLSISGRLRASVLGDDGAEHMVREMGRGEVIGEMSLYTDEPRSATVVAIRNSVLVRLAKSEFASLLASSAQMSIALTRQMIKRLTSTSPRTAVPPPVAMALLPVTAGVDAADFARRLAAQLGHMGKVCVVDAASLDAALQQPGLAQSAVIDAAANRRIALHLDQLELAHDFVLLVGDADASAWTQRCSRHSDEILLLADASQPPVLHETETTCLMQREGQSDAAQILVLLHDAALRCPKGTRQWLARRPVTDHVHVRPALDSDMARLARIQSRTAVGLVLAGGGAKGLAHLGLYQALQERGLVVDFVGGTSIGAIMAAMVASDQPLATVLPIARAAFADKPTGDFNLLPLISLIRGRRMRRILQVALEHIFGHPADIEDTWKNYFCVASNYTKACEQVISHGPLTQSLLASTAIPGAFPPVPLAGELLFDGGTFNNFPVSIMRKRRGVGQVIGMDLAVRKPKPVAFEEVPGTWALLRDRLRARPQRRYKLPSFMAYLLNVNIMYSNSRQDESRRLTDLYFSPPLERVGMLQWQRFDSIARQGYDYACEVLDAMPEDQLRAFRSRA